MSTLKTSNIQHGSASTAAITLASDSTATLNGLAYPTSGSLSGRNRIINGDMRIDQRALGTTTIGLVSSKTYTLDRWAFQNLNGTTTYSAQSSTIAPAGFTNSMLITTVTSGAAGTTDSKILTQYIEGFNVADLAFGTASAAPVTLSFWVRSSLTGSFGVGLSNDAASRSYAASYTINAANTWEKKTITIPGDTTGTWLTNNGEGFRVSFNLGSGSTYNQTTESWGSAGSGRGVFSGVTSLLATPGATFYITGVQLEAGTVATPFERRSYGQELALCQRYYWRISGTAETICNSANYSSTAVYGIVKYPVTMRSVPTLDISGVADYAVAAGGAVVASTNIVIDSISNENSAELNIAASVTSGQGSFVRTKGTGSPYIGFASEL